MSNGKSYENRVCFLPGCETGYSSDKKLENERGENNQSLFVAPKNENEECKRFPYFFRKFCEENEFSFATEINNYLIKENRQSIQKEQPTSAQKELSHEQLNTPIINTYCDVDFTLKKVICQSPHMDTKFLIALNKTVLNFSNLFTLRLDYCDLTSEHIRLLAENLKCNRIVKELSLKGNPNEDQNFDLLIECGLKILNLKFCGVNEHGLRKIAGKFLKCSPYSTLIHVDLSSNMVFDEGCVHVAKILRCDRTLQSLNLSDCKIRDDGFEEIMKSFQKFSLDAEEIYVRRKMRIEYYKLLQKEKDGYFVDKKNCLADGDQENVKDALTIAEEKLKKHPFTSECVLEDEDIFCQGNYKLESLNMSYNHLTKQSFDLILKILMEQASIFGFDKGFSRFVLDGNPDVQKSESARNAIEDLLLSKEPRKSISGSVRMRSSLKRRKSSAAESIKSKESSSQQL